MTDKINPLRTHPVRRNGTVFICTYTPGHYDKCQELIDEWTEGTTWSSIWGVPYDVEVTLATHYRNTCTIYDHRKSDILEAKQRAEMGQ